MTKKNKSTNFFSVIIGMALAFAVAWYAWEWILKILLVQAPTSVIYVKYIYYGVFIMIGGILGGSKPIQTELFAFCLSILIALQYAWDFRVGDISAGRTNILFFAIVLLIVNLFTGRLRVGSFIRTLKKSTGLK